MDELKRIKKRLERKLSQRGLPAQISELHWRYLVIRNEVRPEQDKDEDEDAIATVLAWREADESAPRESRAIPVESPDPDPRYTALSEILADRAGRRKDVIDWRQEHLKGRLLAPEKLPSYFERVTREYEPALRVTVYADQPIRHEAADPNRGTAAGWLGVVEDCRLQYRQADGSIGWTPIAGPLCELADLATSLATDYEWLPHEAATFVLTGLPPRWFSVVARFPRSFHERSRITLEIDPRTPAREVARAYEEVRSTRGIGESRRLDEKTARLAAFLARTDPGSRWRDRCDLWNELEPGWSYAYERSFRRDAIQAWKRVAGEDYGTPLPPP